MFNITWINQNEKFCPSKHLKNDFDIIQLEIKHTEGELPIAKIKAANLDYQQMSANQTKMIMLCYNQNPIFKGIMIHPSVVINENLQNPSQPIHLEFLALPENAHQQMLAKAVKLRKKGYWHPLFDQPKHTASPTEIEQKTIQNTLNSGQKLFCFDRLMGKIKLSHILKGKKNLTITNEQILADSLKIKLIKNPLHKINISLTCQWTQQGNGEFDIFPSIAKKFPGGMVNTFTKNALENYWPQNGDRLHKQRKKTGYMVVDSRLTKINPPQTGILNIYPTTATFQYKEDNTKIEKTFARHWYKGKLLIAWDYSQNISQTFCATILNATPGMDNQNLPNPLIREKNLHFNLENPANFATTINNLNSFFQTTDGQNAIEFAKKIADAYFIASHRNIEFEFKTTFEIGCVADLDTNLHFSFDLGQKKFNGKVTKITMMADCNQQIATITGMCAASNYLADNQKYTPPKNPTPPTQNYLHEGDQTPFHDTSLLMMDDLVQNITIDHPPDQQIKILQNQIDQNPAHALRQKPTLLKINLTPMNTKPLAVKKITATKPYYFNFQQT